MIFFVKKNHKMQRLAVMTIEFNRYSQLILISHR